jgi:hypothetical protein
VSRLAGNFSLAYYIWYNEKSNELIKMSNTIVVWRFLDHTPLTCRNIAVAMFNMG